MPPAWHRAGAPGSSPTVPCCEGTACSAARPRVTSASTVHTPGSLSHLGDEIQVGESPKPRPAASGAQTPMSCQHMAQEPVRKALGDGELKHAPSPSRSRGLGTVAAN